MAKLLSHNGYYLWHFLPSVPAAILFIALFLIAFLVHGWRMFRHRVWFHLPFVIGCALETIGYVGYLVAYNHTDNIKPYIVQSVTLLVSPALLAATIYMILGRLTTRLPSGASCSFIRPRWLTRCFVCGDVLSFILQASGGGMMMMSGLAETAQHMIIFGLFVQIVAFGLFLATAVIFHIRYARLSFYSDATGRMVDTGIPWRKVLWMLYIVSALIMVRSVFRAVEYIDGSQGYALTHQWTLFVFDSTLMILATLAFFVMYHPKNLAMIEYDDTYTQLRHGSNGGVPLTSVEEARPKN